MTLVSSSVSLQNTTSTSTLWNRLMMQSLHINFGLSIIDHDVSIILSICVAQYQHQYSVTLPYDAESPYNF